MKKITEIVKKLPEFQEILSRLENGRSPVSAAGLLTVHRAHFAAALQEAMNRPVILVAPDETEAQKLQNDLASLTGELVPMLAGREFVFHNATASRQWEHRRLAILRTMQKGAFSMLIVTAEGLLQRTMPPETLKKCVIPLEFGTEYDLKTLPETLVRSGYVRTMQVEGPGQSVIVGL